jgi:ACS family glucarate transporter-like MFS transporter
MRSSQSGLFDRRALVPPLASLIPSMSVAALGVSLPELREALALSAVQAGSLFSFIFIFASLGSAFAGRLSDRIGRKRVMVGGVTMLACGFSLASLASSYAMMASCLALTGVGYGFTTPSLYALMSDVMPERRGLGASLVSVSYGFGVSAGAIVTTWILARSHWPAAFLAIGMFGFAIAAVQGVAIENVRSQRSEHRPPYRAVLNRDVTLLALAEFFGGSVFFSSASWTASVLRAAKGLTIIETGFVMSLWGLTPMIGALLLGPMSDRFGRRSVILSTAFPAAVAAFVTYQWLATPAALAGGLVVFGILKATVPTLIVPFAQEAAAPEAAGAAAGVIMSMHYFSAVVAPLATGALIAATGDMIKSMILTACVPLVVYGSLIAMARQKTSRKLTRSAR